MGKVPGHERKEITMDYQHLLKDKRVFITTGARGIGKAIALLFAQQGAVVAVGGNENKKRKAVALPLPFSFLRLLS